jgi:hypothetical protein
MHRITAATRRGSLPLGRGIASVVVAAALALPGVTALAQSPTPGTSPAGTTFVSQHFPYSLELPPGWDVLTVSQTAGHDEDLFEGEGASARVGAGPLEDPQQTVADRVESNRAAETAMGCTSDPSMDQATTLGGQEAILWSWSCSGSHHVAINTIHDGLRLRLQVNLPADRSAEAEPLLEALRQSFRFTAPPDPLVLAGVDARIQGMWVNDEHPVELEVATLVASDIEEQILNDRSDPGYWEALEAATTAQTAVRFQDGEIIQYVAYDGGPLEPGWIGTYRLLDERTIEATETNSFNRIVYEFTLRDDVLTIDVVSNQSPIDMVAQTGLFETLPFKRIP